MAFGRRAARTSWSRGPPVVAIHPDVQRQGFDQEVMDVLLTCAFERLKLGAVAAALLSVVPRPVHLLRTYTLAAVAYRTRAAHSSPDAVG
jgi:hypothetical protein